MEERDTTTPLKKDDPRYKLIDAAGQIFAEAGYEAATVRQITEKAHVNIAAINYYFGDKQELYRTVLATITGRTISLLEKHCVGASAEARLRQYVSLVLQAESSGEFSWAHLLMAREINGVHGAQPEAIVEMVRPMQRISESIARDLLGVHASQDVIRMAASLLASVTFNSQPQQRMDQKLNPQIDFSVVDLETTIELTYRFVLGGILNLAQTDSP